MKIRRSSVAKYDLIRVSSFMRRVRQEWFDKQTELSNFDQQMNLFPCSYLS